MKTGKDDAEEVGVMMGWEREISEFIRQGLFQIRSIFNRLLKCRKPSKNCVKAVRMNTVC